MRATLSEKGKTMKITDEISIPTTEIEADGFITPPSALERIDLNRAKPVEICPYPKCEECDKYHALYCTVPMVISKQMWQMTSERISALEKRLIELETLVYDEIWRSDKGITIPPETKLNYTLLDYIDDTMGDE